MYHIGPDDHVSVAKYVISKCICHNMSDGRVVKDHIACAAIPISIKQCLHEFERQQLQKKISMKMTYFKLNVQYFIQLEFSHQEYLLNRVRIFNTSSLLHSINLLTSDQTLMWANVFLAGVKYSLVYNSIIPSVNFSQVDR